MLVYIAIMYGTGALIRPIVKKHSEVEFSGYALGRAVVTTIGRKTTAESVVAEAPIPSKNWWMVRTPWRH